MSWEVEKLRYKTENQQLMERLEATNRLYIKVCSASDNANYSVILLIAVLIFLEFFWSLMKSVYDWICR